MFQEGTFLWYWYEYWIVVVGFALAVLLAAWLLTDSGRREGGAALWRGLMILGVLMPIPMVLLRIGVTDALDPDLVGYLSVAGTGLALLASLLYLIGRPALKTAATPVVDRLSGTPIPSAGPGTGQMGPETALQSGAVEGTLATAVQPEGISGTERLPGTIDETEGPAQSTAAETVAAASESPARAWLEVKSGDRAGARLPLKAGETSIGRISSNDHVISDPAVSRSHIQITEEGGAYTLVDLGSRSGTRVNGKPVSSQRLHAGDAIAIGETELVFVQPEMEGATRMSGRSVAPIGDETIIVDETPPQMAWLTVRSGPQAGANFQLQAGDTTIGRSQDNSCAVSDPAISRRHCLLRSHEGKFRLYDLASRGGTRVNGRAVGGWELKQGDVVMLGRTEMAFMLIEGEPGVQAGPPPSMPGETVILQESPGTWAWLVVKSGPAAGKMLQMKTGDTTLGRDPASDHRIDDQAISRNHAVVRFDAGKFILYDLASRGGTRVNGEVLGGHPLQSNDVITIGRSDIVFTQIEGGQR